MPKTLTAQEQSLAKIFSDDYVFHIPGYQRPYAWTTVEAGELLDDLTSFMQASEGPVEDMPPYFLGSIVLIKKETLPNSDVVDGQQRLTTLTILLAAIRASVTGPSSSEITHLLYEKGSTILGTRDRFRLTLRTRDAEFFQTHIQKEDGLGSLDGNVEQTTDSQRNIRKNALFFLQKLSDIPQADRIRLAQFMVTRCYLVVVATPDLDAAYRIFSVLNSRGLDLSATDILKSEIIGGIPEAQRDVYTKRWEDTEEDLGRDRFAELFSHIRMVYRRSKPKGTLIREFREHVTELNQPATFIDQILMPMARSFEELATESYESAVGPEAVNDSLKWLNRLEFTDWMPPALAFTVRHRMQPEVMKHFFCDLERLAYGLLITRAGINDRIDRFSSLTSAVLQNADLYATGSPLQLSPEERTDAGERLNGPFYESFSARARTTLLLRIDALLSGGGAQYDYKVVTVEHVLPQTPPAHSEWTAWFPEQNERDLWTHRLGNMALLTRKKNTAASNYDFDRKKQAYFAVNGISPFVLTTQVLQQQQWTPLVLEQRQAELLTKLKQHWRLHS